MPCWPLSHGVPRPGTCFHPSATPASARPLLVPEHYFSLKQKSMTAHRPLWHRPSPHICSGYHGHSPALRSPAKGPALSFSHTPTETVRRAVSADEGEKHLESARGDGPLFSRQRCPTLLPGCCLEVARPQLWCFDFQRPTAAT